MGGFFSAQTPTFLPPSPPYSGASTSLFSIGADLPAEELIRVEQGADYGWPQCYFLEVRPVLRQLVPPVLGGVEVLILWVDGDAIGVADAGGIALRRREGLPRPVGVVAPDVAARLKLLAGLSPGDFGVRFAFWQELVAVATSTNSSPLSLIAKGCME